MSVKDLSHVEGPHNLNQANYMWKKNRKKLTMKCIQVLFLHKPVEQVVQNFINI